MNISIAIAIFLFFLAGIIALQFFYFKTDRKLLLLPAGGLGLLGGIVGLMLSTYYGTALERIKGEVLFNYGSPMDQIDAFEGYILICIFASVILFGTTVITLLLPFAKKILEERGITIFEIEE